MPFDPEPLKEPRGFLRLIQWFIALLAFATCCDFSLQFGFTIVCVDSTVGPFHYNTTTSYPFRPDHNKEIHYQSPVCNGNDTKENKTFTFPGDFSSDAQFYVFTGVMVWLYSTASLALYLFYSGLYTDEQKNYPKIDFILAAFIAFIWLAAASAWANGFLNLKSIAHGNTWIYTNPSPCEREENDDFRDVSIASCEAITVGGFGKANASILFGFLNCFLWASNTWFLYKETAWYRTRNNIQSNQPGI